MKIICGFNVNIDAIYNIKGEEVSNLVTKYPIKDLESLPDSIHSISDFVNGLVFCMKNGEQGEILIQKKEVYQFLKDTFLNKSIIRIGGNAGIMANVLAFKGVDIILHSNTNIDKSLFLEKDKIIINSDKFKLNEGKNNPINFIFDFKKEETIRFKNKSIRVPRENRFIASPLEANYSINTDFIEYVNSQLKKIDGAIFSGFHVLSKEKYQEFIEYVKSIKQKNANILVHLELGYFIEKDGIDYIFSKLSDSVDSIGMNESELAMLFKKDSTKILNMDAKVIIDAAIECQSKSNLKKIIIHTREFVISIFDPNNQYIEPILELKSLQYGVKSVARFAAIGKLDNHKNEIECLLSKSQHGLNQVNSLIKCLNGIPYEDGFFGMYKNQIICLTPTFLSEKPISTVGLGDTIIANIFLKQLQSKTIL